jgi:hypothetical protein
VLPREGEQAAAEAADPMFRRGWELVEISQVRKCTP